MISALTGKYPCFGVKWFMLLFSLQSIFGLRRVERERERLRLRWTQKPTLLNPENPRLRKPIRQTHSIAPRKPIRSNPENPFVKPRKPIRSHHLRPSSRRLHHWWDRRTPAPIRPKLIVLVAPQNQSFSCYFCWVLRIWVLFLLFLLGFDEFGFCPRPSFVILDPDSSSPFIEPSRLSLSLSLSPSLNLTGFDDFVLLGFVSFVFIYWEMILIFVWKMRKCEKHDKNGFSRAFSKIQPNTRKYFPKDFLECNQTLENIFLSKK